MENETSNLNETANIIKPVVRRSFLSRIPDFYKELSECRLDENDWDDCPKCLCKPRLWIFDNGEFAKCGCNSMYDKASAQGISIWEYHKANNGDMTNWNHNNLRDNWNEVVAGRKNCA